MMFRQLTFLVLLFPATSPGAEGDDAMARQDYMLNCQGCHLADGAGVPGVVPDLRGEPARLLGVAGGREYLVQVPGAANSALDDARLAAVTNWILREFNGGLLPGDFRYFTAEEVARLRPAAPADVKQARSDLLKKVSGLFSAE